MTLPFASVPSSPGGSDTNLQYNNAGDFGGFADGTSTQVLHGGRTFSAVDLSADTASTKLPLAKGGTNADLSATGGTSQVLKQTSSGAAITVARLAASDLSDTATSGNVLRGNGTSFVSAQLAATDLTGVLPPANGGVAVINTSAQGYVIPHFGLQGSSSNAVLVASANQVRCFQFVLPVQATLQNMRIMRAGAGAAGDTVGAAIYSADGSTRVLDFGTVVSSGAGGTVNTLTAAGAVTLNPGVYTFAWTQTGTPTTTFESINFANGVFTYQAMLNAGSTKRQGTAGNSASAGAMPSSLGTITAANVSGPSCILER